MHSSFLSCFAREYTHRILIEMIRYRRPPFPGRGTFLCYCGTLSITCRHFASRAAVATPPTRDGVFCVKVTKQ